MSGEPVPSLGSLQGNHNTRHNEADDDFASSLFEPDAAKPTDHWKNAPDTPSLTLVLPEESPVSEVAPVAGDEPTAIEPENDESDLVGEEAATEDVFEEAIEEDLAAARSANAATRTETVTLHAAPRELRGAAEIADEELSEEFVLSTAALKPISRPSRYFAPDDPIPETIRPTQREAARETVEEVVTPTLRMVEPFATESAAVEPDEAEAVGDAAADETVIDQTPEIEMRAAETVVMETALVDLPIAEQQIAEPVVPPVPRELKAAPPIRVGSGQLSSGRPNWKPGDPFGESVMDAPRFRWELMLTTACGTAACGLAGIWLLRTLLS